MKTWTVAQTDTMFSVYNHNTFETITAIFANDEAKITKLSLDKIEVYSFDVHPDDAIAQVLDNSGFFNV